MSFIKRVRKNTVNIGLKPRAEAITLQELELLIEEVKKDFPLISVSDTHLIIPTGEYGSFFGFMFLVPEESEIPSSYEQ